MITSLACVCYKDDCYDSIKMIAMIVLSRY